MIMNPELSVADTLFSHRLEPEVYSMELLEGLCERARIAGITAFPIHLKVVAACIAWALRLPTSLR